MLLPSLDHPLPAHPRLYAEAARFEALQTQSDAVTRQIMALLRVEAERHLTAAPVSYPRDGFLMGRCAKCKAAFSASR